MNRDMYLRKLQQAVPASLFIALEGLSALPAMAGDGVVILQREVPVRPAIRDGNPGHAVTIDTSPDDKVQQAVGQSSSIKPTELDDTEFAAISTGAAGSLSATSGTAGLSDAGFNAYGLGGVGNSSGSVQSISSTITGAVGGAVGGATGQLNSGVIATTGALGGITGVFTRGSGQ